jgi:ATP-binding cassette subfamily B protein
MARQLILHFVMKDSVIKNSRRFIVPEIVQTSAMDCGPASLKCLLEGFGVNVSYGRLREACQTDVDGTSIDTMEEVAKQLGLDARQIMIPVDHLLIPAANALPAIVVVRLPDGNTHFVVAWRQHGRVMQIMDPATGRRWPTARRFLNEIYLHTMAVPASDWRDWAGSEEFLQPLRQRLSQLGIPANRNDEMIGAAQADVSWRSLATLDAATRMVNAIIQAGGIKAGPQATKMLRRFYDKARQESPEALQTIPHSYWSVRLHTPEGDDTAQLLLRGAVLVHIKGLLARDQAAEKSENGKTALSPELVAALSEPPARPGRELVRLLFQEGWKTPGLLIAGLFMTALGFFFEALVLRSVMEVWGLLNLPSQRLGAMAILILFALALVLIQAPIIANFFRFGRRLELRLRMAFLAKIPRLGDRYFQSRPVSDMAQRSHAVHQLRTLPDYAGHFLRAIFEMLLTVAGIAWLDPAAGPLAFTAAILAVGIPVALMPMLQEQDMRARTHSGALSRFYLDALLGLIPIRNHGAERAVRSEHEGLLAEWARTNLGVYRTLVLIRSLQALTSFGLAAWILFGYLARTEETSWALLLAYWALNLPVLGETLAQMLQLYPGYRNTTLRLLEPLGAPEEAATPEDERAVASSPVREKNKPGAMLALEDVNVRVAGHEILRELNFTIAPGNHVAIVGPSGAGKSSLVGIFLGWHRPATGRILVDGEALNSTSLQRLRQETAWVDPAVQLWNRSLFDNLHYGLDGQPSLPLGLIIEQAELIGVLQKLEDGLQAPLGEGGGLVSGGEGQRVRLARAMLRPNVRLAILDEPFRGLDREQRRTLLARTRQLWQNATLICITHDVGETLGFDRVLVIENGRVVDDGVPEALAQSENSRYHALLQAENAVREELWADEKWRKIWLGTKNTVDS